MIKMTHEQVMNEATNVNWNTPTKYNNHEVGELESIDTILRNLRANPDHYNHGTTHEEYMQEGQRD